jgi:hypothetical protein
MIDVESTVDGAVRISYPRRDVVTVPGNGWALIRFITHVPGTFFMLSTIEKRDACFAGVWQFHCHVEVSMFVLLCFSLIFSNAQWVSNFTLQCGD